MDCVRGLNLVCGEYILILVEDVRLERQDRTVQAANDADLQDTSYMQRSVWKRELTHEKNIPE